MKSRLALTALTALLAACGGGNGGGNGPAVDAGGPAGDAGAMGGAEAGPGPGPANPVTYHQHVAPILGSQCVVCHAPGGIGPFALDSAEGAQRYAPLIKAATQRGDMPPWPPGPLSPAMMHERRLTTDQLTMLAAWADTGALLGDPAHPAAIPPPAAVDIGTADLTMDIGVDYVADPALSDDYRCFLVDPHATENRMITGYRITPGNRKVVHHVITTLFAASDRAALEALDARTPERAGWPCVGGPVPIDSGLAADGSLGAWVPGVSSVLLPAGTGTAIKAGDLAVVQVHYNRRGGTDPDRTRIEVKLAPRGSESQLQQLATIRLFKRQLVLPANQSNIVQENTLAARTWTLGRFYPDGDAQVVAVAGHMHTLGTRITLERRNGQETTVLLDIPHWHFHWQGSYQLVKPITVKADDQLTVRCVYDNTAERRAHEGVSSPVVDVGWGEGTEDEMCIGYVVVVDRMPM
jgi:mono/diheme cytochrome c family protein